MSAIIDIGRIQPFAPPVRANPNSINVPRTTMGSQNRDTVELSSLGRGLSPFASASSFRTAWIQSIRAEIHNGTYETPERINKTVDHLLDVLA